MGGPRWSRPGERFTSRWRAWVPAAFVLFSLFALLIAPLVLNARIADLRDSVVAPAQDARGEINDIRHAFTRGEAAIRGLLLTGEERFLDRLRDAQEEENRAFERLLPLALQLDPSLGRDAIALLRRSRRAAEARSTLLHELREGQIPDQLLAREEERHDRLLEASAELKADIVLRIARARERMRALERVGIVITVLLTLLALISAALVIRTGRGHRQRAEEEAELRSAAFALAEATEVGEVLRRIATIAASGRRGEHSYVERIDLEADDVEVVAAAGERAPAVGTRVPYPGSLTEEAIRSGAPEVVPGLGSMDRPISRVLADSCGADCTALVIPLLVDRESQGALVILRTRRRRFRQREVLQGRALGVLAAMALRKTVLLERAQQQRQALERVVESREGLIRGFSHDVKNPLGAADGHAQLLAEQIVGELSPRQQRSVEWIRSGISTALELINDLIDLARAESGQLDLSSEEVDVRAVAEQAAGEYAGMIDAAGLRLEIELPPSLPAVHSDAQRIKQILSNLLSNAVKYTPEGGVVRVTAELQEGRRAGDPVRWVTVSVSDTGPGIPAEEQDLLFREFRRLDPGTAEGAGLGLAISDRVARLLGGEITLRSEVGEGSTFTLWIPAERDGSPTEP